MRAEKFKGTEIGKIPEDWEILSVEEVAEVIGGGTPSTKKPEYWEGDIAWITPKDLSSYKYRYIERGERNISKKGLENSSARLCPKGTVLLTTRAPVGYVAIAKNEVTTNQGFRSLVPSKKATSMFLYYLLLRNTERLKSNASGTTFGELSGSTLKALKFAFPAVPEQESIAAILSSLDEKIELNQQMSQTLEAVGQAIFKHWFVDFEFPNEEEKPYRSSGGEMVESELGEIPTEWKVSLLDECVISVRGCSYRSEDLQESNKALVTLKSIERGGGFKKDGFKEYTGEYKPKQVIADGEIVVAHTDLTQNAEVIGKPAIVSSFKQYDKLISSLDLAIVRPKNDSVNRAFLYYLLKSQNFQGHAFGYTNGTTVLHLSNKAIPEYKFVLPVNELVKKFGIIVNTLLEMMKDSEEEIDSLTSLRDSLLPKLMSGRIRVPVEG